MIDELQRGVDYIYCDECKIHVPCIPLEPGVWEVQCPKCVGECSMCHCHLATHCFGQGGVAMQIRIKAVGPLRLKGFEASGDGRHEK